MIAGRALLLVVLAGQGGARLQFTVEQESPDAIFSAAERASVSATGNTQLGTQHGNTVVQRRLSDGKLKKEFVLSSFPKAGPIRAGFSPDGEQVLVCRTQSAPGPGRTLLEVLDRDTGEIVRSLRFAEAVERVLAVGADRALVALAEDEIGVVDFKAAKLTAKVPRPFESGPQWTSSADGAWLAIAPKVAGAGKRQVAVLKAESGKFTSVVVKPLPQALAFSVDQKTLAVGGVDSTAHVALIELRRLPALALVKTLRVPVSDDAVLNGLVALKDGGWILSLADRLLTVSAEGTAPASLMLPVGLQLFGDGERLVREAGDGTLRVVADARSIAFDPERKVRPSVLSLPRSFQSVLWSGTALIGCEEDDAFHLDSRLKAESESGLVTLLELPRPGGCTWARELEAKVKSWPAWPEGEVPRRADVSSIGRVLSRQGDDALVFDVATGEIAARLKRACRSDDEWLSPRARWLAMRCADGSFSLRAVMDEVTPFSSKPRTDSETVTAVTFSDNESWMALGREDGRVDVYDTVSWTVEFSFTAHAQRLDGLSFSPGGQQLASWSRRNGHLQLKVWALSFDSGH